VRRCIELKVGKIKISFKLIIFIIIAISFTAFIFFSDLTSKKINVKPTQPGATTAQTDKGEGDGGSQTAPAPPPAAPPAEEGAVENRVKVIAATQEEIDGHKLIASNNGYEMYVKEENLSIIIRDKKTGAVMYSTVKNPVKSNEEWTNFMQSGIVMEYLVGTNVVVYKADMFSGNPVKKVTYKNDGFTAEVSYPKLEISFEVDVTLTESGFTAEIPKEKIVEDSAKFKVSGFYVYPFLGYSKLGEREGYMFIPDGSGALIHLKDNNGKFKQPYSEMVYGGNAGIDDPYVLSLFNEMNPVNDPENILAPVFGMVQTDSQIGYLGIIEEGDLSSKIEAYPSGAILPYNWITSKFVYRQFYNQPTSKDSGTMVVRQKNKNDFNIKVRYQFVSGDKANYTGLALNYRDYLIENKIVSKKDSDFKVRVDLLGADKENGMIFKKTVPMTTFEQANSIFNELKDNGVENILSIYKGWQKDGIYGGLPITKFQTESELGSEDELVALVEDGKKNNIDIFLDHDALRINSEEHRNTNVDIMKKFNKRTYNEEIFGKVYRELNYLHPNSSVELMAENKEEYVDNGVNNLMLSGISNKLFSYSHKGKEYDRITTKNSYDSIVQDYNQTFNLLLEQPFSYFWKYTDAIIDMPTKSSNYIFTDEEVPFFTIALKGIMPMYSEYINFQANQKEFYLQLVEQGLFPSFYNTYEDPSELLYTNSADIYSSKFERYEETIVEYYDSLKEVYDQTANAVISNYERLNGVTKVTYDNGIVIYVNYQDKVANIDGLTIDKLSYKVVQTN
jgi:hypothetical protein